MGREGSVQDHLTMMGQDLGSLAMVDHGGRHQSKTRVMVLVVVPLKEGLAKPASVFDRSEAIRETGTIFQGPELTF
jgi:hypothetical protein